jgi:ABC-type transport system involved in multi-copper enzyme maturation permease subunit
MRKFNNTLASLIGVWFIVAPWVLNFSNNSKAVTISLVVGAIMAISSLLSFKAPGFNLISLLSGVWFIVFPFILSMDSIEKWVSVVLGAIVVALNLWND